DADIGLDGAERVVLGRDARLGQGVEGGGLADIGQADDAALETHGGFRKILRKRKGAIVPRRAVSPGLAYDPAHVGYRHLPLARRRARPDCRRPHGVLAGLAGARLHSVAAVPYRGTAGYLRGAGQLALRRAALVVADQSA